MTTPAKPKVVHVYRHPYAGLECNDAPEHDNYIRLNGLEYLGEYAPRGPVVAERWQIRDGRGFAWGSYPTKSRAKRGARLAKANGGMRLRIVHITTRKVCR